MNPQEIQQVVARDEKWVPFTERVKINSTNVRLESIVPQKEETFQVVIDLTKNSSCFKAFTISADILEIFMQQVKGVDFNDVPDDDATLAFLIKLEYKGPLYKHTKMFVNHMHQPWRTLAAIINKGLSGKIASNDKLRNSIIDILWGMFYRENVDYPKLIWEDLAFQIDHKNEKTVRVLPNVIKYSTGQIPPKKSKGKGSQRKKTADNSQETVDVSEESEPKPEPVKRKTASRRVVKKKVTISADGNIISDNSDVALELGKSISKTEAEEAEAARQVHATHARIVTESVLEPTIRRKSGQKVERPARDSQILEAQVKELVLYQGLPMSPQSSLLPQVKELWGSEQESEYPKEDQLGDDEKDDKDDDADDEGNDYIRDNQDTDDEDDETKSDEEEIYKYKIRVRKDADEEMLNTEIEYFRKYDVEVSDAAKADAEKTEEEKDDSKKAKLPPTIGTVKDTTDAEISSLLDIKIQSELRVAKLEKDMSELKKIDLSAEALVALKTQVPSVVDNYLRSKVGDDENAMDKGVADTVKDHKRKHDDEDDDDEDPPAGPNQGKALSKGSKTGKSASAKEPVEEPTAEVVMDDVGEDVVRNDDQPQDTSEPKTTKTPNPEWFTQPPRPPTFDPEWNKS
ncbi:hypothetical protein Tco_0959767 [Tanacetum coccineum]